MKRCLLLPVALLLVLALRSLPAKANDQEFVIGAGIGAHNFADSDEFRQSETGIEGDSTDITQGVLTQIYGEWYAFDDVGVGLRAVSIAQVETFDYYSEAQFERKVTVTAQFLTVNWVPLGSERYARLGVLGGLGVAQYEARDEFRDDTGSFGGSFTESETSTGSASLIGAYVDWGADGFGARFGMNVLNTELDPIESNGQEYQVDGSGAHWYFDLRWAFK